MDASLNIGCGHVYRSITLADKLTEMGCYVQFICSEHTGNLIDFIADKGYRVHKLPVSNKYQDKGSWLGRDWFEDAKLTRDIVANAQIDWLIVDHYAVDYRWHKVVNSLDYQLMVIDDLADRMYDCDCLLDQTYGRVAENYLPKLMSGTELLLGTDFGLLRDEFVNARASALSRRHQCHNINTILLSLGGTDSENITEKILCLLETTHLTDTTVINLIVGPNNPNRTSLELKSKSSRFRCDLHFSVTNMAELMVQSDLAIGAAGSSAWERCVLSLPSINITLADNQKTIATKLDDIGVAMSLGEPKALTSTCLAKAINNCQTNYQIMVKKAGDLVDGIGASRVAFSLFTTWNTQGDKLYLKRASLSDCECLFNWQQAPTTRRYALVAAIPSWQEHCQWFRTKVIDPNSFLFMIRRNNTDVGMVRLDPLEADNTYQISIITGPEYYRQGVAKSALELIRKAFNSIIINATVLSENIASKALFHSMGYVDVDKTHWVQYPLEDKNE